MYLGHNEKRVAEIDAPAPRVYKGKCPGAEGTVQRSPAGQMALSSHVSGHLSSCGSAGPR